MKDSFRNPAMPMNKRSVLTAVIASAFGVFAVVASYLGMQVSVYQWLLTLIVAALTAGVYLFLKAGKTSCRVKSVSVFLLYLGVTYAVFYPTIYNVFRSDYWLIAVQFHDGYSNPSLTAIKKIAFFEMFGNIRFQPLAHLMMFARFLVLGNNVILYNILNFTLHAATAFFIYFLLLDFTEDIAFSAVFGLLFIAFPSQFDTVSWNYHIYIIAGTILPLASYLLARRFVRTNNAAYLWCAVISALISIFLYEPALLVPASLFFIIFDRYFSIGNASRRTILVISVIAGAYIFYLGFSYYGFILTKAKHNMALTDMLTTVNIYKTVIAVLVNLWESTFLKNLGLVSVDVLELVYVRLPESLFSGFFPIIKIISGLVIISMFRINKKNILAATTFLAVALSYLFVISMGRVLTNDQQYIITQPRYQYFANAFMLIVAGLLLWPKYSKQKNAATIITVILAGVFFWNMQSTLLGSDKVRDALGPLDAQYYRIKNFINEHADSKILIDYSNGNEKLSLGSDVALDVLFNERVTRLIGKATHIYNGESFAENPSYVRNAPMWYLADFTVGWAYRKAPMYLPSKDVSVLGHGDSYPKVSITPNGYLKVDLRNAATGNIDVYLLEYPYNLNFESNVSTMIIEKDGETLCLIYDGLLYDKVRLNSAYKTWNKDGVDLIGDYYRGLGEPVFLHNLLFRSDLALWKCSDRAKGERIFTEAQ